MHRSKLNRLKTFRSPDPTSIFSCESALSLTGSASRTDLSQLANGIWEIHAVCPSFLRVLSVAKIGYIPQFKASNARDQDEVLSDLVRMVRVLSIHRYKQYVTNHVVYKNTGKSCDHHMTFSHFRVAKMRHQTNECVMNCNVLMYKRVK